VGGYADLRASVSTLKSDVVDQEIPGGNADGVRLFFGVRSQTAAEKLLRS
jgi:hypothetical protein